MIEMKTIKPTGWLKKRMEMEVSLNVIDKLPQLVPSIFNDDIFAKDRIGMHTPPKDLGTLENDDSWNIQLYWWNSETIGNYYDGLMRYGFLLENTSMIKTVSQLVNHILASQEEDGYIGIYTKSFRYHFKSENGELWAKTTIGRFLLGYYHYTKAPKVLDAVIRMTANVMENYPIHRSTPFQGDNTFAGVAHGLMFVDVLHTLYEITKDDRYIAYAIFLYEDYNQHNVSEKDGWILNLKDPNYRFKGHGVHTYEHLRAVAIYDHYMGKNGELYQLYLDKLSDVISPSGGPIGDEWIMGNICDSSLHGYEFCSIHELMASWIFLTKLGMNPPQQAVKKLFFNANMGAHHPEQQTIAYLKSDNSYVMKGSFQVEQPHAPHKIQTRYKYSPTHQDAAVCCVPNAVRITPYFIDGIASIQNEKVHIHIIAPVIIQLLIDGISYTLEIQQSSIFGDYQIQTNLPASSISIDDIQTSTIEIKTDNQGDIYFECNGIVFAYPIASHKQTIKTHLFHLEDIHVHPNMEHIPFEYAGDIPILKYNHDVPNIEVRLVQNNLIHKVHLVPMGLTDLRQVTFKMRKPEEVLKYE
jgi:hypothetical protein